MTVDNLFNIFTFCLFFNNMPYVDWDTLIRFTSHFKFLRLAFHNF